MRPNDRFFYVKNNQLSIDSLNLIRLYLPIIGKEALVIYQYLLAFWDDGRTSHAFSEILNHLDMGWNVFEKALDQLIALRLLELYQSEETYQLFVYPNLTAQDFFENHVYRNLLEQKIGETSVEKLLPVELVGEKRETSFLKVIEEQLNQSGRPQNKRQTDFDLTSFKQLMARDGLRFENEKGELLELFQIAESQRWTWYETYILAKETAVAFTISTKRMREKLRSKNKPKTNGFSHQEETIISEAQAKPSLVFLAEIKQTKKASITQSERMVIQKMAELGLLDEVINVIVLFTFNKINSANLNEKYALKVANDFSYQGILTAEQAVLRIRERSQERQKQQKQNSGTISKNNIPKWSQPDYKNETNEQTRLELERKKQELLARLEKGGD
ncbi:Helicase loader DnaB [Streptococcus sp. DD10]|uniref:DnaD domain protein n=1 Tax=Streptococcus sp. DD10 TaxID=1777878 RepID=UPI000794D75D|nr:DnaD domain protein [Streptococcus sp. DD10]KXT73551.1 Helicase loader DnaB [Streptococcus sp. DD10]